MTKAPGTPHELLRLAGKTVAVCVTGSIAAYKAVELVRILKKRGAEVLPVMTASAARFVGPVTLSGIAGKAVAQDMWDPSFSGELHIALAAQADAVVVVPATADVLARLAQGRADDLVTALVLSARGPVLAAPAMHPRMWSHPATQRNVRELQAQGRVTLVGPVDGPVASGEEGMGRMAEPSAVADAIERAFTIRDLADVRLVVTAGPTVEDLDPVRFLGNRSSGKMGFAIAERAAARGASVALIAGPVSLTTPHGVRRTDVRSALELRDALWSACGTDLTQADALVMTAAVADYRPAQPSRSKIKKSTDHVTLDLVKNPDLLAEVGHARTGKRPVLIGFAVETGTDEELTTYARGKLTKKRVDLVVANAAEVAFGGDGNRALLVDEAHVESLPAMSKHALADVVLDQVRARLGG